MSCGSGGCAGVSLLALRASRARRHPRGRPREAGSLCAVTNPTVNSYKRLADIPSSTGQGLALPKHAN
eukprot:9477522-Pyramimonas_sp.AAC.1